MTLNRDFDREQQTGECSYCGYGLEVHDQGGFFSCPFCDAYDQEAELEEMEDFITFESFDEALEAHLWDDNATLYELQHEWGIAPEDFWEIIHRRRADKLPAMTEADAVGEAIEEEKNDPFVPPDNMNDIPF